MSLLKRKTPSQKELDQLWSNLTFGTSHRNRQISDAVMASGFHLCDQRREVAVHAESEVQFQLHQRLQDMSLWVAEFTRKSEEVTAQVERVKGYADRVKNAAKAVAPILTVDWDVFKMREARIGVDLVADDPHKALLFEVGILEGEEQRLIVLHLRVEECLRLLRRMGYVLGKELDDRKLTVQIDHTALALDAHSSLVVAHNGGQIGGDESKGMAEAKSGRGSTRNPLLPTLENEQTWESLSWKHCAAAEKLLKDADALLVLVESTLQSSCERIQTAVCDTNAAFEARLIALRRLKCHLEEEHEQISINIRNMEDTLDKVKKSIVEKEASLALAMRRIALRATRPNLELVKDQVQKGLELEVTSLQNSVVLLQQQFAATQRSLRALLASQLRLEEEINVKMQSLAVDEANVLPARKTISVRLY